MCRYLCPQGEGANETRQLLIPEPLRDFHSCSVMVQGTTSDAGEKHAGRRAVSLVSAPECECRTVQATEHGTKQCGYPRGGEIGRAQAVQAQAARIAPHSDMNPVLLKPNSDTGAQVIIQGHSIGNMHAVDYHAYKQTARAAVFASYARLETAISGHRGGGCGQSRRDQFARRRYRQYGVCRTGRLPCDTDRDIDRGGVFCTYHRHAGATLNHRAGAYRRFRDQPFRGDLSLLQDGLDWLEHETGKPVIGVLPICTDFIWKPKTPCLSALKTVGKKGNPAANCVS